MSRGEIPGFYYGKANMINLEYMKEKLNQDLEQEAKESGRLNPDTIEGTVDLEQILEEAPEDEKGNKIIEDHIFDQYYRSLPTKCVNKSGTWRTTSSGGKLKILGGDPDNDKEIQRKGAETLNAIHAQRRTMAEDITIMLAQKARPETIASLGLTPDANNQQAVIAAALLQAIDGNVKAQQFIRDTIGEQPTAKQDLNVSMSEDDRKLLDNISDRLDMTESLHNDIN